MNKKIIALIFGIFLVGTVVAIQVGEIITQEQLDSIDFGEYDFGEYFLRDNSSKVIYDVSGRNAIFYVHIPKTIELIEGDYTVINATHKVRVRIKSFVEIKKEYGKAYAVNSLKDYLISKRNQIIEIEKSKLEDMQSDEDLFNEIAVDIEI